MIDDEALLVNSLWLHKAGLEMRHLAVFQSEGFCAEIKTFLFLFLVKQAFQIPRHVNSEIWLLSNPWIIAPSHIHSSSLISPFLQEDYRYGKATEQNLCLRWGGAARRSLYSCRSLIKSLAG
jgi:hypothetical protein